MNVCIARCMFGLIAVILFLTRRVIRVITPIEFIPAGGGASLSTPITRTVHAWPAQGTHGTHAQHAASRNYHACINSKTNTSTHKAFSSILSHPSFSVKLINLCLFPSLFPFRTIIGGVAGLHSYHCRYDTNTIYSHSQSLLCININILIHSRVEDGNKH